MTDDMSGLARAEHIMGVTSAKQRLGNKGGRSNALHAFYPGADGPKESSVFKNFSCKIFAYATYRNDLGIAHKKGINL